MGEHPAKDPPSRGNIFKIRPHLNKTLRVTPAMAAGVSDHVWSLEEIVGLLDAAAKKAA